MSETPETDRQQAEDQKAIWGNPTAFSMSKVNIDFARKLERERNELNERHKRAEPILSRLATGYLVSVLDEATPGEELGQRVLEYWREIEQREETKT